MKILAPKECGEMKLNRYKDTFSLSMGDQEREIPNYMVSKSLRQMKPEQLAAFLQTNYVTLTQCSDGEFSLQEHGRLNGGGFGGALGGVAFGEIVGKGAALAAGYLILYGTKAVIRVSAGKEAAELFDEHLVQVSIPRLHEVSEYVAHAAGLVGGVAGGVIVPG